jgi:hypothetical protein
MVLCRPMIDAEKRKSFTVYREATGSVEFAIRTPSVSNTDSNPKDEKVVVPKLKYDMVVGVL